MVKQYIFIELIFLLFRFPVKATGETIVLNAGEAGKIIEISMAEADPTLAKEGFRLEKNDRGMPLYEGSERGVVRRLRIGGAHPSGRIVGAGGREDL